MKFTSRFLLTLIVLFSISPADAQFTFDTGIKISSFDQERYQLEQRFHLKSPYTLVATYAYSPRTLDFAFYTYLASDTTIAESSYTTRSHRNTLKFGVQRKLSVFATDVFYAGLTLGMGLQKDRGTEYTVIYKSQGDSLTQYEDLYTITRHYNNDVLHSQLTLSFGMDVPLTKRFILNAEVSLATFLKKSLSPSYPSQIEMNALFSGGIRYQFGKRKITP